MVLKIRKTTDQILREPVEKVEQFDMELQTLVDNMIETMRKKNGVGLAAPQVGVSKSLFVCELDAKDNENIEGFPLTVICNPEITHKSKEQKKMVEGCLSFPGLELLIKRPKEVVVKGQDRYGKNIEIKAKDFFARVIQHETDHLNSTLLIDHFEKVNVVFIGTGTLGAKTLEYLAQDLQYNVKLVVTGDTKKVVSRNKKGQKNQILTIAKKFDLPCLITTNIKDSKIVEKIKRQKADIGVMADFGQIIPKEVLDAPKHGVINIHPSLLPKYRGPAPIQQPILNSDKVTGVSLILTSEKMDAGDIVAQTGVKLSGSETSTILKDYLSELSAALVLNTLPYYIAGDLKPKPQDETKATYTKIVTSDDGRVDQNSSAIEVERKIRAFDEWPKVYTVVNNKRIQILAAHFNEEKRLIIDRVKPEGKHEMSYADFLNGYKTELTFN